MFSGQTSGSEAAIHAMRDVFEEQEPEAVLLVDAANAFNNINRQAFLHNISILCPNFEKYANNCYKIPSGLFVIGCFDIKSAAFADDLKMQNNSNLVILLCLFNINSGFFMNDAPKMTKLIMNHFFGASNIFMTSS